MFRPLLESDQVSSHVVVLLLPCIAETICCIVDITS